MNFNMGLKKLSVIIFVFLLVSGAAFQETFGQTASSKEDLQSKIQQKTQELQGISAQLQETQKNLSQTQSQRQTLQKQLNIYKNTISQLSLNMKEDSVSIEKLNFEIDSLNYDLKDIQSSMGDKKAAVNQLLVSIQKNDNENSNLLAIFLKSKTLADGILETQSLSNIHNQMKIEIDNLNALSDQYQNTLKGKNNKVSDIETHQTNLSARKTIVASQKEEQQTILVQTKNQEVIYQKQLSELKKLQDQIDAEIEMMGMALRKDIDPSLLPAANTSVFLDPIPKGNMSQGYGRTDFAKKTYKSQWHNGIDIAAPVGTEIYAPADGTVINVGNQDRFCPRAAYGKFMEIKHNNGLTTLYGHLSLYIVSIGQKVTRGQLIGYVGKTGWATGPHTHFTVFASQTLTPAHTGYPEGAKPSTCGPMPVGGDINPLLYVSIKN
ncbi:MAG: peptidoglycan DD-metalloendopeptidase family protein [Candidatus Liptonbacteria bacterium]|nr:peptidoglycan DD-metalloendopeptidase family protein [Candidatus Liptonbacteria bacterium]